MSEKKLQMDQRIDVEEILQDLDQYRPRRRNWVWRTPYSSRGSTTCWASCQK